jgi:hypothetical protein
MEPHETVPSKSATTSSTTSIPGYAYGDSSLARAPFTLDDLAALRKTLLFGDDDVQALRRSKAILADQTDAILDVWYGFVASTPELVVYFSDPRTGQPDGAYLAAVRQRFARWIVDTAEATYDHRWLDWQYEIGLRHNIVKKNKTDQVNSVAQINFRYLLALVVPITTTLKPFLAKNSAAPADVEKMHDAWVKAVLLQVILWSHAYVKDGQF